MVRSIEHLVKRRTGEKVREFPGGYGSVAVSPDGRLIACGGWGRDVDVNSGVVRLFELATGKPVRELPLKNVKLV